MQKQIILKVQPSDAASGDRMKERVCEHLNISSNHISGIKILKRSIDARSKQPWIVLTIVVYIDEPFTPYEIKRITLHDVSQAKHQVVIVGSGPSGLFAALKLLEHGVRPVILERGKDVRSRRRDLAELNKYGIINPESNYCF